MTSPRPDAWRTAGRLCITLSVETICSDPVEHRRRVEGRSPDIAGHALPGWADVLALPYEPWPEADLVIDTATVGVSDAVARIGRALAHAGKQSPL